MSLTKITFEVRHDYGDYTHSDSLDSFDNYEEAKALFDECIADPDEWDDAFEINQYTCEYDTEEEAEEGDYYDGELETLDTHVIKEYVDHDWR